jgi:uncharacterized protein YecE (DUF72 family)
VRGRSRTGAPLADRLPSAYVGTSGWAYASWRPAFYPPELKPAGFLRHYAGRLGTVEVNYTFNHLPSAKNVADWRAATPPEFIFALKASQRITHFDRLEHPADTLPAFWEKARPLGERLGPVLFQTPPWLRRDDDLLAGFVAELPAGQRSALEFRDASWYAREVYEILALRGVALCHADGERAPSPLETAGETADFAYLRLRDERGYDGPAVDAWAGRCRALLAAGRDVYAYFRHDADGSNGLAAERLRRALGA